MKMNDWVLPDESKKKMLELTAVEKETLAGFLIWSLENGIKNIYFTDAVPALRSILEKLAD